MSVLEEGLQELSSKHKATNSDREKMKILDEMSSLITSNISALEEFSSFLRVVDRVFPKAYVPAKAIVVGLDSDNSMRSLLRPLRTNVDKSLVWQLLARLIAEGRKEVASELLAQCCSQATGNGERRPAKDIIRKMREAFLNVPGLKDQILQRLFEWDEKLSSNALICLLYVVTDESDRNRKASVDLLAKQAVFAQVVETWRNMGTDEKPIYENCIREALFRKSLSSFLVNIAQFSIPDEFIQRFGMTISGVAAVPDFHGRPEETPKAEALVTPAASTERRANDSHDMSLPSIDRTAQIESPEYDPGAELNRLSQWVARTTRQMTVLDEEKAEALNQCKALRNRAEALQSEAEGCRASCEREREKVQSLVKQIDEMKSQHEATIRRVVDEGEKREERRLEQARNRIRQDLEPLVKDFLSLENSSSPDTVSHMAKLFKTIVRNLRAAHFIEIDYE